MLIDLSAFNNNSDSVLTQPLLYCYFKSEIDKSWKNYRTSDLPRTMKTVSFTAVLVIFASVSLARTRACTCPNTEVYFVEPRDVVQFPECICPNCSWRMFPDLGMNLTNSFSSEPIFIWDSSAGYGQYICVQGNSVVAKDMDVLILPPCKHTFKGVAASILIIFYFTYF